MRTVWLTVANKGLVDEFYDEGVCVGGYKSVYTRMYCDALYDYDGGLRLCDNLMRFVSGGQGGAAYRKHPQRQWCEEPGISLVL